MIKYKYILPALLLIGILSYACKDERNEHYDRSDSLPDETLYELIKQDENLSKFTKLIETAGYDTLLTSTQTYTVWAPVNDAFSDVDVNTINRDQAILLLNNHIARFNNPTSTPELKAIRMKNKKIYLYSDGGFTFGGIQLLSHDILAKNGLLHTLDNRIEIHNNIYEYITQTSDISKLSKFINQFDEMRFDEELSTPIGMSEKGTVYDTVMTPYNRLFNDQYWGLGYINTEDSIYTMLVPDNNAWDAAYAKISSYFKVYNKDAAYADSVSKIQTSLAILENLIYRGYMPNPPSPPDSIKSTGKSVIHNAPDLFAGSSLISMSNGLVYKTGDLRYNNTETWNKNISVECESTDGRVPSANTSIATRITDETMLFQASNGYYIDVQGTNVTANPGVTFQIPDVLSGKYNIYVEFLPAMIDGVEFAKDSTKLLFELTYMTEKGTTASKVINTADMVTSGTKKIKLPILKEFEFPVSNYYDRLWWSDLNEGKHKLDADWIVTTKLLIKTNVSAAEYNANKFKRRFYVDKIIFESVRN